MILFGERFCLKNFKITDIFDISRNEFSIFEWLCCPDTTVQSIIKLWRGQCHIVMGAMAAIFESRMERLLQFWISIWPGCLPQSAQCNICHVYIFRMAVMAVWHLGYQKGTILAILNLHVAPMHLARFSFTPTFTLRIRTTCAIVQESSISKISPKKIALFFPVCSAEINGLCYIGRGLEGIMWNISLQLFLINLGQWLMRRYHLKIFLS